MSQQVLPQARDGHLVRLVRNRLGRIFDKALPSPFEDTIYLSRGVSVVDILTFLRDDPDADLTQLVDITAANTGRDSEPGRGALEVWYRVRSPRLAYRLALVVEVDEEDDPVVPSLTGLFPAARWLERELWEMFGTYPDGHPDLRRLLLYTDFAGHPMKRGYPVDKDQPLVPVRERKAPHEVIDDA